MREDVLRKYIRESILVEKRRGGFSSGGSFLGLDLSGGPKKWFADFLSQKLDDVGEEMASALESKLEDLLPANVKEKIFSGSATSEDVSENLAKVVEGWIDVTEDHTDKTFSSSEKKRVYDFALKSFVKHSSTAKAKNVNSIYHLVKKDLDAAYVDKKKK